MYTTGILSLERQQEVLTRAKTEFRGIAIDSPRYPLITRILRKISFRKLLNSTSLVDFMEERQRLHKEEIYYGTIEELLTVPYVGLTKEELYSLGLDKERVDACMKANYEAELVMPAIVGKDICRKIHSYRE